MSSMKILWAVLIVVLMALLTAGCGDVAGSQPPPSVLEMEDQGESILNPVKIAVLQDQSNSTNWTRTPQLTLEHFDVLLRLLRRSGGELGFGLIRDESNKGLLRLRIDEPPVAPTRPSDSGNPFEVAERLSRYTEVRRAYEDQVQEWVSRSDERVEHFRIELRPLLEMKPDAGRTDIWGGVLRAELFLGEEDASWPKPTHRWVVLITDGLDNVKSSTIPLKSGARVVLVNGSAELEDPLHRLNPTRFESTRAAFEFIAATEEEK